MSEHGLGEHGLGEHGLSDRVIANGERRRADDFAPAPAELVERWSNYGKWDRPYFPSLVGMQIEEIRTDYCRMRLPFRDDLEHPAGVV
ncbi:MAG: hypothetical protein JWM12_54, partial [Ilumatobacteraceae bacterium]|nr:hypothetical protein [Ilumatobacteraceae bacterium]